MRSRKKILSLILARPIIRYGYGLGVRLLMSYECHLSFSGLLDF